MARQRDGLRRPASERGGVSGRRVALGAALVSIGYVALVAVRHAERFGLGALGLCAGALALGWASGRVRPKMLAWSLWGAGLAAAALVADDGATLAAAAVGALACSVVAVAALARVPSLGGVVRAAKRSPRFGVAALAAVWIPAVVAASASAIGSRWRPAEVSSWLVAGAAGTSALVVTALGAAARLERRFELGAVERLDAFLLCAAGVGLAAATAALAGAVSAAAAACAACAGASVALCALAELGEPVAVWRGVRRAAAIVGLAVVLSGVFLLLSVERPAHEPGLVVALALGALLAGAELPRIARALRGETSRRLAAVAEARSALRGRDADTALAAALHALRGAAPPPAAATPHPASPELWTLDPVRLLRVDAAGYAHEEPATLPPELVVVACGEPEATLRVEALAAVEVRRPDLRPLSQWMRDAHMATATMVARGGDVEAVLFLPTYDGIPDLTLEEARALRELAGDLAPLCHARAKLARSMAREQQARVAADEATTRAERLEHQVARASAHHALAATRLARPAAVGIYSARSRAAYDALERLAKAQAPVVVVARSGVDPIPFLARAHLAGARGSAPLVLVDCTSVREHDPARWRDPVASPLALADGGVLVLLDAGALPTDVQRLVGQALSERRAPWERPDALDVVLAMTTAEEPSALADTGRLDGVLASRAGGAIEDPVRLPGISDRPEDIRSIVTDRLAREGLRARGAPVGIDDAAFALLVDYPFEGEDAELTAVVQKLVARAHGDVVHEKDVRAVLPPAEPAEADGLVASAAGVISPKPSRRRP
jgi:hypothetical protein